MSDTFHTELTGLLPKLRVQALALTRNRAQADDLVQDAVVSALGARASFTPGTNFAAWMHRILRNRFISDVRKRRPQVAIEDAPPSAFIAADDQMQNLIMGELSAGLDSLPGDQREALMLISVHGLSCEEAAAITGCAVGTVKSRVFRARATLQRRLLGDAAGEDRAQVCADGGVRGAARPSVKVAASAGTIKDVPVGFSLGEVTGSGRRAYESVDATA